VTREEERRALKKIIHKTIRIKQVAFVPLLRRCPPKSNFNFLLTIGKSGEIYLS